MRIFTLTFSKEKCIFKSSISSHLRRKEGDTVKLTADQLKALKRKRGELNLSLTALSDEIGITRRTMTKIINHNTPIKPQTAKKINDWIIKQYMND